jgi:hypothetical protein
MVHKSLDLGSSIDIWYSNGGNGLTKAQKTLPDELKKKILMAKGKKKKEKSPIAKMVKT